MVVLETLAPIRDGWRLPSVGLEEVHARASRDVAGAVAFALSRRPLVDRDGELLLVAPDFLWAESGYGFQAGVDRRQADPRRALLVRTRRESEVLWALEETLKSKAVTLAVAWLRSPSLLASRRVDFAARDAGASAVFLMPQPTGALSAARRRWTVTAAPSALDPDDPYAPGRPRLLVELTRSRSEPPGQWILEWDDETRRLRLAAELADHGLVEDGRTVATA